MKFEVWLQEYFSDVKLTDEWTVNLQQSPGWFSVINNLDLWTIAHVLVDWESQMTDRIASFVSSISVSQQQWEPLVEQSASMANALEPIMYGAVYGILVWGYVRLSVEPCWLLNDVFFWHNSANRGLTGNEHSFCSRTNPYFIFAKVMDVFGLGDRKVNSIRIHLYRRLIVGVMTVSWCGLAFPWTVVVINGILTAKRYIDEMLRTTVMPFFSRPQDVDILQQDNAREHVARITTNFLDGNNVRTLQWPAFSPELSSFKHLWVLHIYHLIYWMIWSFAKFCSCF